MKQPSTQVPGAQQFLADKILVDRIFPKIVAKLDGSTILQKIDARTLAAKVLPYLDLKVSVTERAGERSTVKVSGIAEFKTGQARAGCAPDETVVSGGFDTQTVSEVDTKSSNKGWTNAWAVSQTFSGNGVLQSYAECLRAELTLKEVQQSQPTPMPPPGGPPLQPP